MAEPFTRLQIGGLLPYSRRIEEEEEEEEGGEVRKKVVPSVRPTTACLRKTVEAGGEEMLEVLRESQLLLTALPSPHARSLLRVLEHSHTPLSSAFRTVRDRNDADVACLLPPHSAASTPAVAPASLDSHVLGTCPALIVSYYSA